MRKDEHGKGRHRYKFNVCENISTPILHNRLVESNEIRKIIALNSSSLVVGCIQDLVQEGGGGCKATFCVPEGDEAPTVHMP